MRLSRQRIRDLSMEIVREATRLGLVRLNGPPEDAAAAIEKAFSDDLLAEDRLDDEVREILKQYKKEIDQGRMDYNTMFELVKKKLVRDRGIIL